MCRDVYALDTSAAERQKHNKDFNKVTEETKWGSYTVQRLTSTLRDDRRATIPRQQGNLRLTHFQCSQYTWSRNQGNVTSSHAADSVTFAERVGNSKYRPPSMYTGIVIAVLRHSQVLHLDQQVCHNNISDTFVRTSRFTPPQNLSCLRLISPSAYSLVGHDSSSHEELLRISRSVCVGPACFLLP